MKCFAILQGIGLIAALTLSNIAQAGALQFKLTASQQGLSGEETAPNLLKSTILRVKITNKEILQLLDPHCATPFPVGAVLFLSSDGIVYVREETAGIVCTVEETVLSIGAISQSLLSDTDKTTPSGGNYTGSAEFLGAVDLSSNSETDYFYISGPSRDRFTLNYRSWRYTYSWSLNAAGDGELGGVFVLISGSIKENEAGITE